MKDFTRPLMMQVYGEEGQKMETFEDVIHLFRDPDVQKARQKLMMLAGKLGIEITAIPRFLEDYADIFLSISYYRQTLERVTPNVQDFFVALNDLRKNFQMKNNPQFIAAGGARMTYTIIPFASHSLKSLIIVGPMIEHALGDLID